MDVDVVIKSITIEDTGEHTSEPSEMSVHKLVMIPAVKQQFNNAQATNDVE